MTRRLFALAAFAVAACSSGPRTVGARFNGPAAIVHFAGVSTFHAGLRDYLAVASSRGDELRFLDAADEQPVLGPGVVFPLSIPTAPRPLLLASAPLGDGGPDVLVAVSAGGAVLLGDAPAPALQVIETWSPTNRVAYPWSLEGVLGADAEILTVVGMRAPTEDARARILVGATGGRLAVVEFTRATDGSGKVEAQPPVVKALGFDPLDIAIPTDIAPDRSTVYGTTLSIATRDAITTTTVDALHPEGKVFGVAQVDASSPDVTSWTVTALDALAPTVAVAAALVAELSVERQVSPDHCSADTFAGVRSPLVYAALDDQFCGPDKPINCGIVTLDPGTGKLATDPAPAGPPPPAFQGDSPMLVPTQDYRTPMLVPGIPTHITVVRAPAGGSQLNPPSPDANCTGTGTTGTQISPLFKMAPGSGQRLTSALAMVTSSDGRVYWLDLSRWGPPTDVSMLNGVTRVRVTSATSLVVPADQSRVGIWRDLAPAGTDQSAFTPVVTVDPLELTTAFDVWPGFTDADEWSVIWQGPLPSLDTRQGIYVTDGAAFYAAVQSDTGGTDASGTLWTVGAVVADKALGVHPNDENPNENDIVELPDLSCTTTVLAVQPRGFKFTAAGVTFPGGALQLAPAACLPTPSLPETTRLQATTVTVRAAGFGPSGERKFVLSSSKLGYLGRPALDQLYVLAWKDERNDPTLTAGSEALALARKARRQFYPSDGPCPFPNVDPLSVQSKTVGCYSSFPRVSDPLTPGPAIRFRVGVVRPVAPPDPANPDAVILSAGAGVTFSTQLGLSPTFRAPGSGGALPAGALMGDRTKFAGHENDPIRVYVPYLDDQVMAFSPSESIGNVVSIR